MFVNVRFEYKLWSCCLLLVVWGSVSSVDEAGEICVLGLRTTLACRSFKKKKMHLLYNEDLGIRESYAPVLFSLYRLYSAGPEAPSIYAKLEWAGVAPRPAHISLHRRQAESVQALWWAGWKTWSSCMHISVVAQLTSCRSVPCFGSLWGHKCWWKRAGESTLAGRRMAVPLVRSRKWSWKQHDY